MRSRMLLVALTLAVSVSGMEGATCRSVMSGTWSDAAVWSCGSRPGASDVAVISPGHQIVRGDSLDAAATLVIEAGGELAANSFAIDAGALPVTDLVLESDGSTLSASVTSQTGVLVQGGAISSPGATLAVRPTISTTLFISGTVTVSANTFVEVATLDMQDGSRVANSGHVAITDSLTSSSSSVNPVWAQKPNSVLELYSEPSWQINLESEVPNEIAFRGAGGYRTPESWGPDSGVQFDSVRVEMATPQDMVLVGYSNPLVANNINIVQGVLADDGSQINDNVGSLDLSNVGTLTIGELGQLWIGYHDSYGVIAAGADPVASATNSKSPRRGARRPRRIESNSASSSAGLPEFASYSFHPSSIVRFQGSTVSSISTAPQYGNLVIDNPFSATATTMTVAHDADFGPQPLMIAGNLWFGAGSDAVTVDFSANSVDLEVAGDVGPEPPTQWNDLTSPSSTALASLTFGSADVTVGGDWSHRSTYTPGTGLWTFNGDHAASAAGGYDLPTPNVPSLVLANGTTTWNVDISGGLTINGNATVMGTLASGIVTLAGSDGNTLTTAGANVHFEQQIELSANWTIAADANVYANTGIFTQGNFVTNLGHVTIEGGTLNSFNDGDLWIQGDGSVLVLNTLVTPAVDGVPLVADGGPNNVVYGGSGDQQIVAVPYWDLTLQGSGLRNAAGALTLAGNLSVGPSVVFQPATTVDVNGNFNILSGGSVDGFSSAFTVAGNWSNAGSFTANGADVRFDGTASQSVSSTNFASVAVANSAGVNLSGNIFASTLSIESSAVLNAGATTITLTESWSNSGTFNPGSGVVVMNSSDAASMSGNTSFNELRFQGFTTDITSSNTVAGAFVIESGASVVASQGTQTLLGNFINDGTFDGQATVVILATRLAATRIAPTAAAGSTVLFAGPGPQSISGSGSTTFFHLDVNNASGVTQLAPLVSVASELLLTSGAYSANGSNVIHAMGGATVTRGTGWVSGNLKKDVTAPASVLFEVGTSVGYAPFSINTSGGSGSITVGGRSGSHPSAANGALSASRWWQVTGAGFTGNDVTFWWNAADVQGTESEYVAARWDGVNWTTYQTADPVNRTATISGLASFSDFAVGEPNAFTPAVTLVVSSGVSSATAGTAVPVTITAYDSQGAVAAGYDGDIAITFSGPAAAPDGTQPTALDKDGGVIAMGSPTVITFTNGVASSSLQLFAVATLAQVNATDGSISTAAPLEIDVTPGAVATFAWSVPAAQTVGSVFSSVSTLTAHDSWDNVATQFDASSNPVTIAANAPLAGTVETGAGVSTLSGTSDFVSGVADLSSLGVRYDGTSGTGTLTATSVSSATGTSAPVTFAAGAPTQLVVVVPGETFAPGITGGKSGTATSQQAGTSFSATVYAVDSSWNLTSSTDVVVLTLSDTAATAPASQALSGGTATFTLTLRTAGTQTITASDQTSTGVAAGSSSVDVSHGPVATLVLTPSTTAVTAGDTLNVLIEAFDADGNPADTATDALVFTSDDPDADLPTGVSLSAGTANASVVLKRAGTTLLEVASSTTPGATAGSASLTVSAGAFNALELMLTSPQANGAAFSGTNSIRAVDAWGNTVTAFDASSNPVTLSLSGAIASGSVTPAALNTSGDFVSGIADLTALGVTVTSVAGTGTLTATPSSGGASSASLQIVAGTAVQLVVVVPGETFAPGTSGGKSGTPTAQQSGTAFTASVYAVDSSWNLTSSADTVSLALSDTAATAPASQALSSGGAAFSITLLTAGAHTVTATDVTDSSVGDGAVSVNVNAGAAHHLKIELASSSAAAAGATSTLAGQTAGVAFDVVVTAYDEQGNVATAASDVIHFASSDSQATFPPDTALSGGMLNATVTLRTAGVPTITASSVTNPGVLPAVVSVPVSPGPLESFVIEAESGGPVPMQTAGVPFTIRITALDCCGNTVSSFDSSVTISSDGSLSVGSGSTANFVNGSTLHHVEFADEGMYTIFAADSSGKTGQSALIEVGSGCPSAPTLQSPANGATGVPTPVTFFWHASPGAETYRLWVSVEGEPFEMVTETENQLYEMALEGDVEWYVEAVAADCPIATSATYSFTTEAVCRTADTPLPSVVGTVLSGERYDVLWDEVEGAARFHLQQSIDEAFVSDVENFTVTGHSMEFEHRVLEPTGFYYRVAAITDCSDETSSFSRTIRVVVVPQPGPENERWEVTVPFGTTTDVVQTIFVPGVESGEVEFIATTDQPWMTVHPDRGTIGPQGRELEVHSNTASLQVGANTGTVIIEYLGTASSGRLKPSGDNKKTSVPVSISLVTPVKPAPKTGATASNALIIPAVAHSSGVNSQWRSDVRITNTASQTIRYVLSFTQTGTDATVDGKKTEIEIKPNQTVALDDIVRNWYGLGSLNDGASGVLEIVPQSSTGSMPPEALQLATAASSRTYNVTSTGTFGQYIPAIPFSSFIGKSEESQRISRLSLQQISQTSTYRTNIGLVEGAGQPAEVKLTFFDGDGDQVHTRNVTLKPGEQQQINQILATAGVTLEDGRMEVEVLSDSGRVTAYASTVDNRTGDPILVPAVKLPLEPAETYVIPGVADLVNSLANWRTDLRVFNPSDAPVPSTLVFYPQNNGGTPVETQVVVPAGGVLQLNDLLRQTFGLQNAGGAVHIETPVNADLVVTARTFNQTATGTYGQFIPAVTAADAAGVGDRPIQILQIEESDRFRTNLGLVEVTGAPVEIEITVLDPSATATPVRRVQLTGGEFRQMNRIVSSLGLGNTYNTRIAIRVVGGAGRLAAYASVVDNRTQDPTYVPGQ